MASARDWPLVHELRGQVLIPRISLPSSGISAPSARCVMLGDYFREIAQFTLLSYLSCLARKLKISVVRDG